MCPCNNTQLICRESHAIPPPIGPLSPPMGGLHTTFICLCSTHATSAQILCLFQFRMYPMGGRVKWKYEFHYLKNYVIFYGCFVLYVEWLLKPPFHKVTNICWFINILRKTLEKDKQDWPGTHSSFSLILVYQNILSPKLD